MRQMASFFLLPVLLAGAFYLRPLESQALQSQSAQTEGSQDLPTSSLDGQSAMNGRQSYAQSMGAWQHADGMAHADGAPDRPAASTPSGRPQGESGNVQSVWGQFLQSAWMMGTSSIRGGQGRGSGMQAAGQGFAQNFSLNSDFPGASMSSTSGMSGQQQGGQIGSAGQRAPGRFPGMSNGPGGAGLLGLATSFSSALGASQHGVLGATFSALPRFEQFMNSGLSLSSQPGGGTLHFSLQSMMNGANMPTAQGGATYSSTQAIHGSRVDFSAAATFGSMQGGGAGTSGGGQHGGSGGSAPGGAGGGQHGSSGAGLGPTVSMHLSF